MSMKKPKIRFKGYTEDWEQRKLGECVEFLDTQRKPLEGAKRISGSYPYYGASGIVDYVDDYLFDEELVLLSEDGANITDRNYPVCFLAAGKYWVNNHAHVLKTLPENENNFICNSLERKDYTQYNTGMAMPKLNKEVCKNIPVECPSYEEQKKIGDYFRTLDHLITLHQRKCNQAKKLKKYMHQKMFPQNGEKNPEIRFDGFTDDWEQRKLGKVFKTYSGMTPLRSDISNFKNPEVPWIKTTDLKNSDITSNDEKISAKAANKLKLLPVNTVLIAMYGGFNQIGRTGLLTYPATINQALTALEPNDSISPYFLLTELNYRVNDWKKFAASSRKDPNITKRDIDNFMINFPTQQEQQKIGSFFQQLDNTITLHQRKLDLLKEQKKGFLQKMFV